MVQGSTKQIIMPSALVSLELLHQNSQSLVLYKEKVFIWLLIHGAGVWQGLTWLHPSMVKWEQSHT